MKNSFPSEALRWAEFRTFFRTSKFIIFMQPPYVNLVQCNEKSYTIGSDMMSRIQNTCQIVEVYYFMQPPNINFLNITKNLLQLVASWWAEFISLFRKSKCIIFIHPLQTNFLKHYEQFFIIGRVTMSRIQTIFQNFEVYYF